MHRAGRSTAVLVLATTLAVSSAGCAKRSHGIAVAAVGAGLTIASSIAINRCAGDGCGQIVLLLVPSIAITAFGAVAAITAGSRRSPDVDLSGISTEPLGPDAEAVSLTGRARISAQRGDCADVLTLAPRVELADEQYFHNVFRSDPQIAACLASAPPPAAPPAPPPDAAPGPAPDAAPSAF